MNAMSGAERQRRYRDRHVTSRDEISRMFLEIKAELASLRDFMVTLAASSRNEKLASRNGGQAKSTTSETIATARRKGASIINSNWNLSLEDRKFAADLGLEPDRMADEFRDYWISEGRVKTNWSAAFRNWCRKAQSFGYGKTPASTTNGHSPKINEFRAQQLAELARKGIHVLPGSMT